MATFEEWLGQIAFTHFYRNLAERSNMPFDIQWDMLPYFEKQSYIEAAKAVLEAASQLKGHARSGGSNEHAPL